MLEGLGSRRSKKDSLTLRSACAGLTSMFQYALGAVVVGASFAWYFATQVAPIDLPGGLEPEGDFAASVDHEDDAAIDERKRDFVRIVKSRTYLFASADGAAPRLVAADGPCDGFDACARLVDEACGKDAAARTFTLLSATTPFDFARHFGVTPHFGESRYVVVASPTGAPRVAWAALLGDARAPGAWPFFVLLLSEPLRGEAAPTTRFRYSCSRTSGAPSLAAYVDRWFAANQPLVAGQGWQPDGDAGPPQPSDPLLGR